jgi:hypothetical protein
MDIDGPAAGEQVNSAHANFSDIVFADAPPPLAVPPANTATPSAPSP